MVNVLGKYVHWLHTRWPAGGVEKLPRVDEHGQSNILGLYIVGDLTGIPLLKFSADTGARAVQHILTDETFLRDKGSDDIVDLAIIGAGVSGMSAALEARGVVRAVAEAQRRKNGTVDKRQFLGDFDKEHLLGKTFGGGGDAGRLRRRRRSYDWNSGRRRLRLGAERARGDAGRRARRGVAREGTRAREIAGEARSGGAGRRGTARRGDF